MRKQSFLLWTKETASFLYFHHGIFFYRGELFDCTVNFKFYVKIFIFLNITYKSNIKGAIFELRSSHLFRDQPYKEVLEVKCQACNFTGVLSFTRVFEVLVSFFRPVLCRTSHNLICNKFAILKDKKLTNILEIGKF